MTQILHIIQQLSKGGAARSMIATAKYSAQYGDFHHQVISLLPSETLAKEQAEAVGMSVIDGFDRTTPFSKARSRSGAARSHLSIPKTRSRSGAARSHLPIPKTLIAPLHSQTRSNLLIPKTRSHFLIPKLDRTSFILKLDHEVALRDRTSSSPNSIAPNLIDENNL